jgi:hypothetical protein
MPPGPGPSPCQALRRAPRAVQAHAARGPSCKSYSGSWRRGAAAEQRREGGAICACRQSGRARGAARPAAARPAAAVREATSELQGRA